MNFQISSHVDGTSDKSIPLASDLRSSCGASIDSLTMEAETMVQDRFCSTSW